MNADLVVFTDDTAVIEASADPGTYVVLACERAKEWLTQALEHGDIEQIVDLKSKAEAIRVYTTQRQLGKDAGFAAAEIVRRAERGIGVCIRKGQEAGEIATRTDASRLSKDLQNRDAILEGKASSSQFFRSDEERSQAYAMTDGVSDEEFDEAIEQAKAEGNLSRANVVRKVKKLPPPASERPELLRKTRHHDSNRIIEQTVQTLEGVRLGVELIDYTQIDDALVGPWVDSLRISIRILNRLVKELSE